MTHKRKFSLNICLPAVIDYGNKNGRGGYGSLLKSVGPKIRDNPKIKPKPVKKYAKAVIRANGIFSITNGILITSYDDLK